MKKRSIYIVYVLFSTGRERRTARYLESLERILSPNCVVVVVNNRNISLRQFDRWVALYGSNVDHEFSGWQEGLNYLSNTYASDQADVVVFINDTVLDSFENRWTSKLAAKKVSRLTEHIDVHAGGQIVRSKMGEVEIFGSRVKNYVATNFFFLTFFAIGKIGLINPEIDFDRYVEENFNSGMLKSSVPITYSVFYQEWLGFGRKGGIGKWGKSKHLPFAAENFSALRKKLEMILRETNLTARLNLHGIRIADTRSNLIVRKLLRISSVLSGH